MPDKINHELKMIVDEIVKNLSITAPDRLDHFCQFDTNSVFLMLYMPRDRSEHLTCVYTTIIGYVSLRDDMVAFAAMPNGRTDGDPALLPLAMPDVFDVIAAALRLSISETLADDTRPSC